jgi:hypothetical protein
MAAVLACGPEAVLSHGSAGRLWRILPPASGSADVTQATQRRSRSGIAVHRSCLLTDEVTAMEGIPVTSAMRTLFDLAGVLTMRQMERAMNEAEVLRLTDKLSLHDLLARHPRRWGAAKLRALLAGHSALQGITRSELEERFVAFLDEYGLPRPQLNAGLTVRGRFIEVDCLWRGQRVIVELDGRAVHDTAQAFEGDRRRDRALLAEGWRSMRVTWLSLHREGPAIAADLRGLLNTEAVRDAVAENARDAAA